eukprot:1585222-Rhodomonas_salina.1
MHPSANTPAVFEVSGLFSPSASALHCSVAAFLLLLCYPPPAPIAHALSSAHLHTTLLSVRTSVVLPVLTFAMLPVLTFAMLPPGATKALRPILEAIPVFISAGTRFLQAPYAMSGTDAAYCATSCVLRNSRSVPSFKAPIAVPGKRGAKLSVVCSRRARRSRAAAAVRADGVD